MTNIDKRGVESTVYITYIVATYNCVKEVEVLAKTISSLDGLPVEFIVSDGGSSDGTLEALAKIPNLIVAQSSPDEGIYDAWNKVIVNSNGLYIGFIGIDDMPTKKFILEAIKIFTNSSSYYSVLYGNIVLIRKERYRSIISPANPKLFTSETPVFDIPHQGLLQHRTLFENHKFDKKYKLAGDLHFLLSASKNVPSFTYKKINQFQSIVSEDGVSRSASAWSLYLNEYCMIESDLRLKLGYSKNKILLLSLFKYTPRLFDFIKSISWLIRGKLDINVSDKLESLDKC